MNIQKLTKVLLWNIISNKRELRRSFVGMTAAFCIITASQNINAWSNHFASYANTMSSANLCLVGTAFAMLVWASQVCFNMTTKTSFINYAMLPATNVEKYVSNVLYQTLLRIAIVVAALITTDALQAIISLAMTGNANSLVLCALSSLQQIVMREDIVTYMAFCFFAHSTFLLGGTLFRRRQFLLTCLAWVVVPFVFSLLAAGAAGAVAYMYDSSEYDISMTLWFNSETYEHIFTVAIIAVACFDYWLSYRLFRRSQVINNRFFN